MRNFIYFTLAGIIFLAIPSFAQSSQARSSSSTSIFASKEGNSVKKSSTKRNRKAFKNSSTKRKGLFAKKKGSDCDCPGSPKAKRKRRR